MPDPSETNDARLLDLLRQRGGMSIAEMVSGMGVTQTAVRQRLGRLMRDGWIRRDVERGARGRPGHRYELTERARRQAGTNFADLSVVLWREIRSVQDLAVRRGLLQRIAEGLAALYAGRIRGNTLAERMASLRDLFADRRVPLRVELDQTDNIASFAAGANEKIAPIDRIQDGLSGNTQHNDQLDGMRSRESPAVADSISFPILTVNECPYPELAELDRGICAVEKMLFSQLLGQDVRLTQCRLDGANCCQFQAN